MVPCQVDQALLARVPIDEQPITVRNGDLAMSRRQLATAARLKNEQLDRLEAQIRACTAP